MKTRTGFGIKSQPRIEYQVYNVELKKRLLRDNSELLLGTATIQVPKSMVDPTGQTFTKREVWDAFARAVCYCLISSKAGEERGLNQVFLFDNRWNIVERVETNVWSEGDSTPSYQTPLEQKDADIAWEAFQRCEVKVRWLDVPVVA